MGTSITSTGRETWSGPDVGTIPIYQRRDGQRTARVATLVYVPARVVLVDVDTGAEYVTTSDAVRFHHDA
jgi:hypothetical protein